MGSSSPDWSFCDSTDLGSCVNSAPEHSENDSEYWTVDSLSSTESSSFESELSEAESSGSEISEKNSDNTFSLRFSSDDSSDDSSQGSSVRWFDKSHSIEVLELPPNQGPSRIRYTKSQLIGMNIHQLYRICQINGFEVHPERKIPLIDYILENQ